MGLWLTGLVLLVGCGPRPPVRHPGISGLERDWSEAVLARSPGLFAALFRDQRLDRAPGLTLSPGPRLGGRLVSLRWMPDPSSPLGPGLLGQVGMLESVSMVRVHRLSFHSLGARRARATLRIRMDGRVRGGYPRSDMGIVALDLWRRAYHGPWYVADLRAVSLVTMVGLGQAFVDRTMAWLPGNGREMRHRGTAGAGRQRLATDDFDGDGHLDLAWWNGGAVTFWRWGAEGFRSWGSRLSVAPAPGIGGDGLVWRLVDRQGDGRPELVIGNHIWVDFSHAGARLHRTRALAGNVGFSPPAVLPRSLREQLGEESKRVECHVSLDLDQDGRSEYLLLVRHSAKPSAGSIDGTLRLYWWLPGRVGSSMGRWVDVAHAAGLPRRASAFAAADFDGDGGVDLALVTRRGLRLYRNLFDRGEWARVLVRGPMSRPFVGAKMTVTAPDGRLLRSVRIGAPGTALTRFTLGLGHLDHVDVSLQFRNGLRVHRRLTAGSTTVIAPGRSRVVDGSGTRALGPSVIDARLLKEWLGLSSRTSRSLGRTMVLLVCKGSRAGPCRAMAAGVQAALQGRGVRVVLAWLSPPNPGGPGERPWIERLLDPARAARYRKGGWLPRLLLYRQGALRSVWIRPRLKDLSLELESFFFSPT